jgi:N-acetylmuramoyl-L-alanine amidase
MFGWFKKKQQSLPAPQVVEIKAEPLPQAHERIVHVGFVVGHDKKAQGAVMVGASELTEYQYNKEIANKILEIATKDYPTLKVSIIFRDGVGIAGAYQKAKELLCDCVIELHFNASEGKKATGTETLCTPDANDVEFAHIIHKQLCQVFGRDGNSRGVVVIGKSVRGAPNVYAFPDGVNCLVEPFFGDSEAKLGIEKEGDYANALLQAVMSWAVKHDLLKPTSLGPKG